MNTRFFVHSVLACASLACFNASAADLKEVYERALTNDPLIREADANRLATRESKPQAIAALLPQVNADGTWNDKVDTNSTGVFVAPGRPLEPDTRNFDGDSSNWNLELRQSVFRWENYATYQRANSERAQAEADYVVAQQDLILRTAEAYFNVLAARDTLEAAQAAYDAIGRQLEQSEKRFEVGLIAVTDVQDAKAAFDSASAALIQAKRNVANNGEILRELTGDTWDQLEKPGNDMPLHGPNPENPDDWVKLAMDQNPSLNSSRLAAEITRSNINFERGGHFPGGGLRREPQPQRERRSAERHDHRRYVEQRLRHRLRTAGDRADLLRRAHVLARAAGAVPSHGGARAPRADGTRDGALRRATPFLGVNSEMARVQSLKQAVESAQTALAATRPAMKSARAPRSTCSRPGSGCSSRRPTTRAAATTTC
jgi:outer membrane protein